MKIEESKDGTLRVIELDPTKWYWFIVDEDNYILANMLTRAKRRDGVILLTRPGGHVQLVENADRLRPEGA